MLVVQVVLQVPGAQLLVDGEAQKLLITERGPPVAARPPALGELSLHTQRHSLHFPSITKRRSLLRLRARIQRRLVLWLGAMFDKWSRKQLLRLTGSWPAKPADAEVCLPAPRLNEL